ncbi:MAG TPA: DNA-binding response regulator [Flavobacteriales bacterium]|nr:DNA-binding response regulator [Flavobacteriales bacterium]
MKILVVEDEVKIASFLKQGLNEQGYEVDLATEGRAGKNLIGENKYDLVLLDLLLPYIGGLELCEYLKEIQPETPCLMLTALGTTEDKLIGFDKGADDYLVKPFDFLELLARIKVLTKRNVLTETKNTLEVGDLVLDLDRKIAIREHQNINLTAKEFGLLEYLMRNKGRLVSRVDISEHVWDINFDTGTNIVEVYINILRKKIDKDFPVKLIHTRIGLGYMISDR